MPFIEVERNIDAERVLDVLDQIDDKYGTPKYPCFDNGPEFIAHAVAV